MTVKGGGGFPQPAHPPTFPRLTRYTIRMADEDGLAAGGGVQSEREAQAGRGSGRSADRDTDEGRDRLASRSLDVPPAAKPREITPEYEFPFGADPDLARDMHRGK